MHKCVAPLALVLLSLGAMSLPLPVSAQEGPGQRVITVTSFDVPYGPERAQVMRFLRERWLPEYQLNPKVINLRVAQHNWGANADQIVVMAEYAEFADIEAPCGAACDEYYEAHPVPEAGTPEREQYSDMVAAWNRVYSNHRDEILSTWMIVAKVEGENMGTVGPPEGGTQ